MAVGVPRRAPELELRFIFFGVVELSFLGVVLRGSTCEPDSDFFLPPNANRDKKPFFSFLGEGCRGVGNGYISVVVSG